MSNDNNSKPGNKRRDTLRKLVVSGGIVGAGAKWSKPVVDSVVLPAHATTSLPLEDPCSGITIIPLSPTNYNVQVTGMVIGPGNAGIQINVQVTASGGPGGPTTINGSTTTNGSGQYSVTVGPFNGCDGNNVTAVISSPSFAGSATCTATAAKICPT